MLLCSKCKKTFDVSFFYKRNDRKRGFSSQCIDCIKKRKKELLTQDKLDYRRKKGREYHRDNKEKRNKYCRDWREQNHDRYIDSAHRSYNKHIEKRREENRAYHKRALDENPVEFILKRKFRSSVLRVSRNKGFVDPNFTFEEFMLKYTQQNGKCSYCNKEIDIYSTHVEHNIAITNGGAHSSENVFFSCPECNFKKGYR